MKCNPYRDIFRDMSKALIYVESPDQTEQCTIELISNSNDYLKMIFEIVAFTIQTIQENENKTDKNRKDKTK